MGSECIDGLQLASWIEWQDGPLQLTREGKANHNFVRSALRLRMLVKWNIEHGITTLGPEA
jgi:hypothetical protein